MQGPQIGALEIALGHHVPVAVLAGRRDIMEHGAIGNGRRRVFLLSATHGAESSALAAADRTIEILGNADWDLYHRSCAAFVRGIDEAIGSHDLRGCCRVLGLPVKPALAFDSDVVNTYFHYLLAEQGILLPCVAQSFAHSEEDVRVTLDAIDRALTGLGTTSMGQVARIVGDAVMKPVFREFN